MWAFRDPKDGYIIHLDRHLGDIDSLVSRCPVEGKMREEVDKLGKRTAVLGVGKPLRGANLYFECEPEGEWGEVEKVSFTLTDYVLGVLMNMGQYREVYGKTSVLVFDR